MRRKLPEPPTFQSDEEEAAWLESDEGQRYLAEAEPIPGKFVRKPSNLVPITMRIPRDLRTRIARLAEERGMGYQTLARQWLLERCREEEEAGTARDHRKKGRRSA
jgi:predicted DNA binding CopG/RHH family protein